MAEQLLYPRFKELALLYEQVPFGGARVEAALLHPQSRVFVDDARTPSVALVCLRGDDIWLLAGAPDRRAIRDLIEHVAAAPAVHSGVFILRPLHPELDALVIREFGGQVRLTRAVSYSLDPAAGPQIRAWRHRVPGGCEVRRLDADLARRVGSSVDADFHDIWPDADEFAERGAGFCVCANGEPASIAWSYGPPGTMMELAVGTAPDARGRGYSTLAASALLAYCLDRRIAPFWMTWEANGASHAVAGKLGFTDPVWHHWIHWAEGPQGTGGG